VRYTRAKLRCNKDGAYSERQNPSLIGDSNFETQKLSCNEHKLSHGSRRGSQPRMTVLARTSSCFVLDWNLNSFIPTLLLQEAIKESRTFAIHFAKCFAGCTFIFLKNLYQIGLNYSQNCARIPSYFKLVFRTRRPPCNRYRPLGVGGGATDSLEKPWR
jgi:hypothetical protein